MRQWLLCVATGLIVGGMMGPGRVGAQDYNHLTCFKAKDSGKFKGAVTLDVLQDKFDPSGQCKILGGGRAALFCAPTDKTVDQYEVAKAPGTLLDVPGVPLVNDRLCYKVRCPRDVIDTEIVSDQFGTRELSKFKAALLCTPALKGEPTTTTTTTTTSTTTTSTTTTTTLRFENTGETIIDNQTGLEWEKKTGTVGASVLCTTAGCPDPHDVNNHYKWDDTCPGSDGGAFTDFLAKLNHGTSVDGVSTTGGFAGHPDWRLPTIEELRTIVDESCGQGSPCTAWDNTDTATYGPTQVASWYWSASTDASYSPNFAWGAHFPNGTVLIGGKYYQSHVRAVRGGS